MRTLARAMTVAALSVAIGGFAAVGTASATDCLLTTPGSGTIDPALAQWVSTSNVPALNTCPASGAVTSNAVTMSDTTSLLDQLTLIPSSYPTLTYTAP